MFFLEEYNVVSEQKQSANNQIVIARSRAESHRVRAIDAQNDINQQDSRITQYRNEISNRQIGVLSRNDAVSDIVSSFAIQEMRFSVIADIDTSLLHQLQAEEQLWQALEANLLLRRRGRVNDEAVPQIDQGENLSIADKDKVDRLSIVQDIREFDRLFTGIEDYNVQAGGGRTILINAVISKFDYAVYKLLQMKANVNIRDDMGNNALIYAAIAGNDNIILCLSKVTKEINAKGINGNTVLHQLVIGCRQSLFNVDTSDEEELEEGIIICHRSSNLYKATQEKIFYLIKDLYNLKANLNALNDEKFSPPLLASAMKLGHLCKLIFESFYKKITFDTCDQLNKGYIEWAREHDDLGQLCFFHEHKIFPAIEFPEIEILGENQLLGGAFPEGKYE